ncbi:MAG: hypothetical protein SCI25_15550, partial [Desulfuromonadales bacterium]|nr:hypothetical protein [Desulfuromonadales bacterium]
MTPTCPKCGAGRTALYRKAEVLESGTKLEIIACRLCSHRLAERQIFAAPVVAPSRPQRNKAGRQQPQEDKPQFQYTYEPCPVLGCKGSFVPAMSRTGMCPTCHTRNLRWTKGHRTTAPRWVMSNGHRVLSSLGFLLGDNVIAAPKPAAKPARPKARKPKARPASPTPDSRDLAGLYQLAKAGNLAAMALLDAVQQGH